MNVYTLIQQYSNLFCLENIALFEYWVFMFFVYKGYIYLEI